MRRSMEYSYQMKTSQSQTTNATGMNQKPHETIIETDDFTSHSFIQQNQNDNNHSLKEYINDSADYIRRTIKSYWALKFLQVFCVCYALCYTFLGFYNEAENKKNITNNTSDDFDAKDEIVSIIQAIGLYQKICLVVSRASAFSMYPVLFLVFISKCRALLTFLGHRGGSIASSMFKDSHALHKFAGEYIVVDMMRHTLFHILRWTNQGNVLHNMFRSTTGITGILSIILVFIISIPMLTPSLKKSISYETRKRLHYLFIPFTLCMAFHVPKSSFREGRGFIMYAMCFCLGMYTLDSIYCKIYMTHKIENPSFKILSNGVVLSLPAYAFSGGLFSREGEKERGGYVYVCFPWIDPHQWHAFSIFESNYPDEHDDKETCDYIEEDKQIAQRQIFMLDVGDWTYQVRQMLQERESSKSLWIQGPFLSPFHASATTYDYDNLILVSSGIGITPALSVMKAHKETRRINLIWVVRDPAMLEFFLVQVANNTSRGWVLIFFTGNVPFNNSHISRGSMKKNVHILKGRPNLKNVIVNIIYLIESKKLLPEKYHGDVDCMKDDNKSFEEEKTENSHTESDRRNALLQDGKHETLSSVFDSSQNFLDQEVQDIENSSKKISLDEKECGEKDDIENENIESLFKNCKRNNNTVLQTKRRSGSWGILYCGGNKTIHKRLHKISETYKLSFGSESFTW